MLSLNLSELIRKNKEFNSVDKINWPCARIKLLSNITINQIIHPLEYILNSNNINSEIKIGEYDNIVQEALNIEESTIPIVFWEICNLKESFFYEIEANDNSFRQLYFTKVVDELQILFKSLSKSKIVIFNEFSHLHFTSGLLEKGQFEILVEDLNNYLISNKPSNFHVISLSKIFSSLSISQSIDLRGFYFSKSLYSFLFLKHYTFFISPIILSLFSKSKKILVLDCDNTLWNGVVGEDGISKLGISEKDKSGVFFKEVQLIASYLNRKGILLALASKNNVKDVMEVFTSRKDMILNYESFVSHKINWNDKASNIIEMSNELNIGIDSFVFVDDSDFEVELVKDKVPQVKTLKVPSQLYLYPDLLNSNKNLFFQLNQTAEDLRRSKMYNEESKRKLEINNFVNLEDYLVSLNLSIEISIDEIDYVDRISQMTQKTNQFNLCTKRYSSIEIMNFITDDSYKVFTIKVVDRFGDSGVAGVCIVKTNGNEAYIDNLLLSCRVLGRSIELQFLNEVLNFLFKSNLDNVSSTFIRTFKNEQVDNFYEKFNFNVIQNENVTKHYKLSKNNFIYSNLNYIKVIWKKK